MESPDQRDQGNVGQVPADDTQKDTSAAQPVDSAPESAQPATPAPDEAERASGQPDDNEDRQIETPDPEPGITDDDVGDDSEANQPEVSEESLTADTSDGHGAQDHPESS